MALLFEEPLPQNTEQKKALLLRHGIALWDVAAQCEVVGSSDASIKNVQPNDISLILNACRIERILTNGAAAGKLYHKLCFPATEREAAVLPSTNPANASYSLEALADVWRPFFIV